MDGSLWDSTHTHYCYKGGWYCIETIETWGEVLYRAEVYGLGASGRTPAEAIQNAARRHQPQPSEESED